MHKYTTYVGMDVHARSIEASAIDVETGEVFNRSFHDCPQAGDVAEWLAALPQPLYCAYESGCTGFVLARGLRDLGYDCDVIAVSTLPKSTKDKKQKCDKLDARAIRREIANPDASYSVVWIPDERTEAERDLCRLYRHAQDECKRAKQRLLMFLMRHGYVWDEKTKAGNRRKPSGRALDAWLRSIRLDDGSADKVLAALIRQLRSATEEARLIRRDVRQLARTERRKPFVDALRCLKGVDVETAVLAVVEIGDFGRFSSGGKVSCWLGTVPTDSSSGEKGRHGKITKAGNKAGPAPRPGGARGSCRPRTPRCPRPCSRWRQRPTRASSSDTPTSPTSAAKATTRPRSPSSASWRAGYGP